MKKKIFDKQKKELTTFYLSREGEWERGRESNYLIESIWIEHVNGPIYISEICF